MIKSSWFYILPMIGIIAIANASSDTEELADSNTSPTLLSIPHEILVHTCSFLPPQDLRSLSITCTTLRGISSSDEVWKPIFKRSAPMDDKSESESYKTAIFRLFEELRGSGKLVDAPEDSQLSPWQRLKKHHILQQISIEYLQNISSTRICFR